MMILTMSLVSVSYHNTCKDLPKSLWLPRSVMHVHMGSSSMLSFQHQVMPVS